MELTPDACYRALRARDPRFDGEFFVGVTTTGVYCRPVCPARTPGRARCRFFRAAALAERDGFRACFRCRPELAPGAAPMDARSRLVTAALARIAEGALDDGSVAALADALDVSPRHLRRALVQEVGATPVELAQSRRLARAKQLLADTAWPITRVAFASGFRSVRRFNALFAERFGRPPSEMRRGAHRGEACLVRLGVRAPFAWEPLLAFLAARATPRVEQVEGDAYRRTLAIDPHRGWLEARYERGRVRLEVGPGLVPALAAVVARVRRLLDLDASPARIAEALGADPDLGPRLRARPGLRVPGAIDGFELAARAVLGQQVSVAAATTIAGRLADALGEPIETPWPGLDRLWPSPDAIVAASPLPGMPARRAAALEAIARECQRGLPIDGASDRAWLGAIDGVGPWTLAYVAMRAGGDPDAFPDSDLALRRALGVDAAGLRARAEAWRPWRAYAAMALWGVAAPTDEGEDP